MHLQDENANLQSHLENAHDRRIKRGYLPRYINNPHCMLTSLNYVFMVAYDLQDYCPFCNIRARGASARSMINCHIKMLPKSLPRTGIRMIPILAPNSKNVMWKWLRGVDFILGQMNPKRELLVMLKSRGGQLTRDGRKT